MRPPLSVPVMPNTPYDPSFSLPSPVHRSTPTVKFLYKLAGEKPFPTMTKYPGGIREKIIYSLKKYIAKEKHTSKAK